jgi:hypothetical protein
VEQLQRKGFLIYEEMRKYFPIYEDDEAVSQIRLSNCSILNFLIYKENLIFFFYQCILVQKDLHVFPVLSVSKFI